MKIKKKDSFASDNTDAYGPMQKVKMIGAVIVLAGSIGFSGSATASTANALANSAVDITGARLPGMIYSRKERITQSEKKSPVSNAVMEIRQLASFTWDEVAQIFNVAPKTIHNWINGNTVSAKNEQNISRVLATLKRIYKGDSRLTRSALFNSRADGKIPFDLLKNGNFEEVEESLGITNAYIIERQLTPLSGKTLESRKPQRLDTLLGTLPDVAVKSYKSTAGFIRPKSDKA
jgi:hypothetical protein